MSKRVLYIFPDRGSSADSAWENDVFWPAYGAAAEEVGMTLAVAAPEHITLAGGRAYWNGESLAPERDIIVYGVRTNPTHEIDLWSGLSVVRCLEELGFWLAIPLADSMLLNEKYATAEALRDAPVPVIPSVRVPTGRDIHRMGYQDLIPSDWFPVFVKPVSWGRGLGCVRCPDRSTLDGVLGLAAGSGAAMLVQPSVGLIAADIRVVVVEGEIVAMYDRIPAADAQVANVSRGGSHLMRTELDAPVEELVELIQARFDLPYVCIDLLQAADGRIWLSELEADGAVSSLFARPELMRNVVGRRFSAYAKRLDDHLSRR